MDTGRFELLTQRSAGPDGVVYSARDPKSGDIVDLHLLTAVSGSRREFAERQISLLQLVSHPSILRCRESNLDADTVFVVTDAAPERSLRDRGSDTFFDSIVDGLTAVERLARAVVEAHRVGLVAGNLAPSQIWWGEIAQLDLLPFRLGRFKIDDELDLFSSPTEGATAETDVYSLGMLLHWVISGKVATTDSSGGLAGSIGNADQTLNSTGEFTLSLERLASGPIVNPIRRLLRDMLSSDEMDRPSAREVASRIGEAVAVLSDSMVDQTKEFSPASADTGAFTRPSDTAIGARRISDLPTRIGRFRILSELGRGAMGMVYKAEDPVDGTIVALKTMKPSISSSKRARRRFLKEARLLAEINNPFVTRLIEANEDDGVAFMALEFVQGQSVGDRIKASGRFDEQSGFAIIADVARGLDDAHRQGIVHRDLKPDNILVEVVEGVDLPRGRLTDFGLARQLEQSESMQVTQAGMVLGTPLYMAPEQWSNVDVGPRADVYALGATLYHMLAGRAPFQASDMAGLMSAHLRDPVPPLTKHNQNVSTGAISVIEKAMAKDPNDRYQDAADLLEELERIVRGEPSSIVMHPHLPDVASGAAMLEWEFKWDLKSTPKQLWPHVSNTDRFNQAMGLPPATFRTESDGIGGTRRFGEAAIGAVKLAWEEHPFEWIEGRRFGVLREFTQGPFLWFISTVELSQRPSGGTTLTHSVRIEPRGFVGKLVSKIQMGRPTRNALERIYRRIDQVASAGSDLIGEDPFSKTKQTGAAVQQRMDQRVATLIDAGTDAEIADRIGQFLLEAPDQEVSRIRPIALAQRLGLDEKKTIDTCLRAVKHGMLTLLWDILCPVCRIPSSVKDTLQSLKDHEHCEACNLDFESDFSTSVELIFRIHPELRRVKTETYCIGGPAHFPHIVAQTRVRSGERVKWTLSIPPGTYRLRSPHLAWTLEFHVAQKGGVGRWELALGGPLPETPSPLSSDHQNLVLHNTAEQELLVRLERVAGRDDAVTAAQASSLATFRELFPNEVMAPGQLANVTRVTLLAVSVGQLDSVYNERGDSGTFAIVHECLRIADEAVQAEGGAVIRINSDGFLAAFEDPIGATHVALKLPSLIAESESVRLPTRIALHRGDAMLTTINGRLDYFGMTVNTVFDLLEATEFGDLSMTQAVSSDPAVATILQENDRHCEFVQNQRVGDRLEPVLRLSVLEH